MVFYLDIYRTLGYNFYDVSNDTLNKRLAEVSWLKSKNAVCKKENGFFYWYLKNDEPFTQNLNTQLYYFNLKKLLPFQLKDAIMLSQLNRVVLKHFTGQGKTIIALATAAILKEKDISNNKILVVSRKRPIPQWVNEIKKFSKFSVDTYPFSNPQADIQIISYARLRTFQPEKRYLLVMYDDAYHLKSPSSQQTKGACKLVADYKWMLNATPIKSSRLEYYAIAKVLDFSSFLFGNYWEFMNKYAKKLYIPAIGKERFIGFNDEYADEIDEKMKFLIFGRDEKDAEVAEQMKRSFEILEIKRYVEMTPTQEIIQNRIESKMKEIANELRIIPEKLFEEYIKRSPEIDEKRKMFFPLYFVMRLNADEPLLIKDYNGSERLMAVIKQFHFSDELFNNITSNKYKEVENIIEFEQKSGVKIIIFSTFVKMTEMLYERLGKKHNVVLVNGSMSENKVLENLKLFENNDKYNILISTDVLSAGMNLQHASCVIHFDLPFTYTDIIQKNGRINRYKQANKIRAYYLITLGSIDERIDAYIEKRKQMNQINQMSIK